MRRDGMVMRQRVSVWGRWDSNPRPVAYHNIPLAPNTMRRHMLTLDLRASSDAILPGNRPETVTQSVTGPMTP